MLEPLGVDLVEPSGGSYESPAMSGRPADGPTAAREAYFLELAAQLAQRSPLPLMLTGGITRRETAEQVLANGVAVVGMASPRRSPPTSAAAGRKAVRPPSDSPRSRGLTRRSPPPPVWRLPATRCAASHAVGIPRAERTHSMRSSAISVLGGVRCAATVRGYRPEHEV